MDHWRKHHRRTARDIPWYLGVVFISHFYINTTIDGKDFFGENRIGCRSIYERPSGRVFFEDYRS